VSVDEVLEVVGPDSPSEITERSNDLIRAEEIGRGIVERVSALPTRRAGGIDTKPRL
jgi:hypothetical protein